MLAALVGCLRLTGEESCWYDRFTTPPRDEGDCCCILDLVDVVVAVAAAAGVLLRACCRWLRLRCCDWVETCCDAGEALMLVGREGGLETCF